MNKGLTITGGVFLFVSFLVTLVSMLSILDYRPTNENILHDTSKDGMSFEYDGASIAMEVYAKGNFVDCENFNLTITGNMVDVFLQDCYSGTDHPGYTYLGDIVETAAGNYTITAEGDIVIVDASEIVGPVVGMCGGSVCCLLGIILLIVGLVSGKKTPQVVLYQQPDGTMYQPNQTTVQQYVPPAYSSQPQQTQPTKNQVVQPGTPTHEPSQGAVPIYQTEFDGFSFEHKKED